MNQSNLVFHFLCVFCLLFLQFFLSVLCFVTLESEMLKELYYKHKESNLFSLLILKSVILRLLQGHYKWGGGDSVTWNTKNTDWIYQRGLNYWCTWLWKEFQKWTKNQDYKSSITSIFLSVASRAAFLLFSHATTAESFFWDLLISYSPLQIVSNYIPSDHIVIGKRHLAVYRIR
jgi:hypothetical protein